MSNTCDKIGSGTNTTMVKSPWQGSGDCYQYAHNEIKLINRIIDQESCDINSAIENIRHIIPIPAGIRFRRDIDTKEIITFHLPQRKPKDEH